MSSPQKMDQDKAKVLFEEGAIFVFLDVPPGTEFGIDYNSWTVGPKFRGVKMIPPGVHFVYYSAAGSGGDSAPRTGFFYNFKKKEVVVMKWNPTIEDIGDDDITDEEIQRFAEKKKYMDPFLGPYPYDNYKKWVALTNHLTESVYQRLEPRSKRICSVTQFESKASNTQSRKAAAEAAALNPESSTKDDGDPRLPKLRCIPGTQINFTDTTVRQPEGATASDVTKNSMDMSYTLDYIVSNAGLTEKCEILGEIQFAFVTFLLGQVYDAFEQWKKLVHLLCSCEKALEKHSDLYTQFITVLHFQIREIPEDFFVDIVSCNNFLTVTLQVFLENLENSDLKIDKDLRSRGLQFRDHLTKKFKWDFTSEPDDYAPVVVDL